jgi:D-lactate dehydrogenase (cytochrome)
VDAACQTVMQVVQFGVPVARMELLDSLSVKAANDYSKLDLPETPLLLMEFHGSTAGVAEQTEVFRSIAEDFGGSGYQTTTTTEERAKLWQARHDMYYACLQLRPGAKSISTDICVPISRLADCVGQTQAKVESLGLLAPIVGHVGDGNFHCLPMIDMENPDEISKGNELIGWLADLAIEMDGTCTGEHGIGQGKQAYLRAELGETTTFMASIKRALDPDNIMNPGKIFAPD